MQNELVILLIGGTLFLPIIGVFFLLLGGVFHFTQRFTKRKLYSKLVIILGLCILVLALLCGIVAWFFGGTAVFDA